MKRFIVFVVLVLAAAGFASGAQSTSSSSAEAQSAEFREGAVTTVENGIKSLLILQTSDLHGHLRTRPDNPGLPYVSGYVREQRSLREDVFLIDSGDWLEKGDLLSYATQGAAMIEAMNIVGFDASTPGNHDWNLGTDNMLRLDELAEFPVVAANMPKDHPLFGELPGSAVLERNGISIGVIGVSRKFLSDEESDGWTDEQKGLYVEKGKFRSLYNEYMIETVSAEVEKLEGSVDLLIVLNHGGIETSQVLAEAIPEIHMVFCGHTRELTYDPVIVESTGAILVHSGEYGNYVSKVDLEIDLALNKIVDFDHELVVMKEEGLVDTELVSWVSEQEDIYAPQAKEILNSTPSEIGYQGVAKLIADALLTQTIADISLCYSDYVKQTIPAGVIDVNTAFATWAAETKREVVLVKLLGSEILAALNFAEIKSHNYHEADTRHWEWSGFEADFEWERPPGERVISSTIDPDREYLTAMVSGDYNPTSGGGRGDDASFTERKVQPLGVRIDQLLSSHIRGISSDTINEALNIE